MQKTNDNDIYYILAYQICYILANQTNCDIPNFICTEVSSGTLLEKFPYSEFFWSVFSRIRTEDGEMLSLAKPCIESRKLKCRKQMIMIFIIYLPTRFVIYLLIRQIVIFQTLFALKFLVEHYLKSSHTRSFSGPYFPAFGLKTERCSVSFRIQSECGKIRTRKLPIRTLFTQQKCAISLNIAF